MTFATIFREYKGYLLVVIVLMMMLMQIEKSYAQVSYIVWGYVHNSDGTEPGVGDISITAYLKKNPSGTHVFSNTTTTLYSFDVNTVWGYYPGGGGGPTQANQGDSLILEFENTNSGSPYFGETGQVRDIVGDGLESDKQFSGNDFTLPVELSLFNARISDEKVVLNWETQSELNNLGFNIFKSKDGEIYNRLNAMLIEGAGTATYSNEYEYVDAQVDIGETYYYRLQSIDVDGKVHDYSPLSISMDENSALADNHRLLQNFPNPFNPVTTIQYSLKSDSYARLSIYNIIGDLITELVNEYQYSGTYSYQWNGTDARGDRVSSGLYFYKLETGQATIVQRMVFTK